MKNDFREKFINEAKYALTFLFLIVFNTLSCFYVVLNQIFNGVKFKNIIFTIFTLGIILFLFMCTLMYQFWKIISMKYYTKNTIIIFYIECVIVFLCTISNFTLGYLVK